MPRSSKTWSTSREFTHTKAICPHCGHDDFKIVEGKFSWLSGEKFKCSKCGGTFKKAKILHVEGKTTEGVVKQGSKHHKPSTQKSRRR